MNINNLRDVSAVIQGAYDDHEGSDVERVNVRCEYFDQQYFIVYQKEESGWVSVGGYAGINRWELVSAIAEVENLDVENEAHYDAILSEIDRLTLEVRKPLQERIELGATK